MAVQMLALFYSLRKGRLKYLFGVGAAFLLTITLSRSLASCDEAHIKDSGRWLACKKIIIVRHCEKVENRTEDDWLPLLQPAGFERAQALAQKLRNEEISKIL